MKDENFSDNPPLGQDPGPNEPVDESWALDLLSGDQKEALEIELAKEQQQDALEEEYKAIIARSTVQLDDAPTLPLGGRLSAIEKQKIAHFKQLKKFDAQSEINRGKHWLSWLIMTFSKLNNRLSK
jgi:hypothetical protein